MRAVIYFITHIEGLEPVYHPIYLKGAVSYIRAEVIEDAIDLSDALDRAQPRPGESVMNSHPYPGTTEAELLERAAEDVKARRIKSLNQIDAEIA